VHCSKKKLPDKAISIWNLHKKFQLSSAMGLRDFDLQSQPTLMGWEPINCRALQGAWYALQNSSLNKLQ